MNPPAVVFWFMMFVAGQKEPARFAHEVENLPACELEAHEFMRHPSHLLLLEGGTLRAGCEVTFTTSQEH